VTIAKTIVLFILAAAVICLLGAAVIMFAPRNAG